MTPAEHSSVESRARTIFSEVADMPADRRDAALVERCGDNSRLLRRARALLAAHDVGSDFLTPPPPLFGFDLPAEGSREPSSEADDPLIGQRIARYRVVRRLAAGGMGVVYLAEQEQPRRTVALKVMRAGIASRSMLRRFEHEAEVLGNLHHPGIAQVYEAGTFDVGRGAQPYFAMEYIDGRPLTEFAQRRNLQTPDRVRLLAQVCDAVHHAHQKGVVHRDLKPDNILVQADKSSPGPAPDPDGAQEGSTMLPQPKILDFGVARLTGSDLAVTTMQTNIGQIVGTLPYMSPEQIAADPRMVDTRSDVYALGVIAFELLAGRLPLDVRHKSVAEAARIIVDADPPTLTHVSRAFRGDLSTIIAKALEKDRARRYQSASALAEDLRRYLLHEPISARPATTLYQLNKFARRHTALVAGVAGVFLMLVLGVVGTSIGLVQSRESARAARRQSDIAAAAAADATRQRLAAEQVSAFLQQMLASVNPSMARGRDTEMLRQILDDAAARVRQELADQPEIAATLEGVIGRTYASIAEYDRAIEHLGRALAARRALGQPGAAEIAEAAGDLGRAFLNAGQYEAAAPLLDEAFRLATAAHGASHPTAARAAIDQANLLRVTGRFEAAERMLREAVATLGALEETDPLRQRGVIDLANALMARRKHREARPLYESVLSIRRRTLPPNSPELASAEVAVGRVLMALDDLDGALPHMQTATEIYRRVMPPGHDALSTMLLNLASLHYQRGDYDTAADLLDEALSTCTAALGPEHPIIPRILSSQSNLARATQETERAERLALDALELRRRILPEHHPDIATSLRQLSGIRNFQGRPQEALTLMREALAIQRVHAANDYDACESLLNIAMQEMRHGDIGLAEESARQAVTMLSALLGSDAPEVVSAGTRLAAIYEHQERFDEALPLRLAAYEYARTTRQPDNEVAAAAQRAASALMGCQRWHDAVTLLDDSLQRRRSFFGDEHIAVARSLSPLGECLMHLGRYDEAETALLEARRLASPRLDGSAEMREMFHRLTMLYEAWGKPDEAAKWRE